MDIYLDQNQWIYLSRAYHKNPRNPEDTEVARRLIRNVEAGRCRVPVSIAHLVEHAKNQDADRRARLAEAFDVYSNGWYFAPWHDVLLQEMRQAAAQCFKTLLIFPSPEMIGRGLFFAVGTKIRNAVPDHWSSESVVQLIQYFQSPGSLLDLLTSENEVNRQKHRVSVHARALASSDAAEEMRQKRRGSSVDLWRRAQGAENTLHHQAFLLRALGDNGKTMNDFLSLGPTGMTAFWEAVPTVHTDSELSFYRDRQWTRAVAPNDLGDFWHLVGAIPYCDVVVTEKFWVEAARQRRLGTKYGTTILSDLGGLLQFII